MVISNNIMAMNAYRQFNIVGTDKKKSIEKLSSGYRINRAADDAAGLSISEKMRSQVRGLHQASKNVQDGISMLQTADGALSEVHNMLHRITELSIEASNTAVNNVEDREAIQKEINQLMLEIDRISDDTEFNKKKLFQGNTHRKTGTQGGSGAGGVGSTNPGSTHTEEVPLIGVSSITWTGAPTDTSITRYVFDADKDAGISINGTTYSWDDIKTDGGKKLSSLEAGTYKITNNGLTFSLQVPSGASFEGIANSVEDVEGVYEISRNTTTIDGISIYTDPHDFNWTKEKYFELLGNTHKLSGDNIDGETTSYYESTRPFHSFTQYDTAKYGVFYDKGIISWPYVENTKAALKDAEFTLSPIRENPWVRYNRNVSDSVFSMSDPVIDWGDNGHLDFANLVTYDPLDVYINPRIDTTINFDENNIKATTLELQGDKGTYSFHLSDLTLRQLDRFDSNYSISNGRFFLAFESDDTPFKITFEFYAKTSTTVPSIMKRAIQKDTSTGIPVIGFRLDEIRTVFKSDEIKKTEINENKLLDGLKGGGTKTVEVSGGDDDDPYDGSDDSYLDEEEGDWWIQAGPNALEGFYITIGRMNTKLLGLKGCDISTWEGAQKAITQAQTAADRISKQRGRIGAQQNRCEHTLYNVTNAEVNAQESESRIRDTDMAEEMMRFSMRSILEQAGMSVLSNANKQTQSVLSLIR